MRCACSRGVTVSSSGSHRRRFGGTRDSCRKAAAHGRSVGPVEAVMDGLHDAECSESPFDHVAAERSIRVTTCNYNTAAMSPSLACSRLSSAP